LKKQLSEPIKGFASLLSFLTIIPTGVHDIELAAKYFYLVPAIGFIEGLVAGIVVLTNISAILKAIIVTCTLFIITGFNHIDGFADFIDVLASRKRGKEALKILKEPYRGAIAIASTTLLILVTYVSLMHITLQGQGIGHVMLIMVLSSESMYLLAVLSREPHYHGLGRLFISKSKNKVNILSNLLLLYIIFTCIYFMFNYRITYSVIISLSTILCTLYVLRKAHEVLGYVTGDVMGFCFELNKTLNLLIIAIVSSIGI